MPEAFIDGNTRRVRVPGVANLYEDFYLEYRPLSGFARREIMRRIEAAGDGGRKLIAADLADRISIWDFTENGANLEINAETIGRLDAPYFTALFNVAYGLAPAVNLDDEQAETDAEREATDLPNCGAGSGSNS